MLNLNNFKSLFTSKESKEVNKNHVFFGNDPDIAWFTKRLSEKPDIELAKVFKEDLISYFENYGILKDEILEYHKIFQLKGWKKEEGDCTQYLIEINPQLRIYFFCGSQGICRRVKFLYKRE